MLQGYSATVSVPNPSITTQRIKGLDHLFTQVRNFRRPGPAQVGSPLKFLNFEEETTLNFTKLSVPKNTSKKAPKSRKPLFPQLENLLKKNFCRIFGNCSMRQKSFSSLNEFFSNRNQL